MYRPDAGRSGGSGSAGRDQDRVSREPADRWRHPWTTCYHARSRPAPFRRAPTSRLHERGSPLGQDAPYLDGCPNAVGSEARPSGRAPARHPSAAAQRREDLRRQRPERRDPEADPQVAAAALASAHAALDRAAKAGAIHPNAAARRKSRLTLKFNAATGGAAVQTSSHVSKTTSKAQAAKAAKTRIALGKANKAKGAQTAAGKARAAVSKSARDETTATTPAAAKVETTEAAATPKTAAKKAPAGKASATKAAPKATATARKAPAKKTAAKS